MKFKVGDKVKFLNEKGGGIVSKIISPTMVHVSIDEGFEIPYMVNELVRVDDTTAAGRFFDEQKDKNILNEQENTNILIAEKKVSKPYKMPEGIYIAFVPKDQKLLIAGNTEIYLINNTPYEIIYALFLKVQHQYTGNSFGNISAYDKVCIQITASNENEFYAHGILQTIYFEDNPEKIIPPLQTEYSFKSSKLLKEDNYTANAVFTEKAFIYLISEIPRFQSKDENVTTTKPIEKQPFREAIIHKHKIDDGFAEVDLHIEKLCDDYQKLDNHAKMQIQLDYFTRCLESAIAENFDRVIFIHGVGAGILKFEITKILQQYDFIEFFDASIAKYGIGATEVLIHQKK